MSLSFDLKNNTGGVKYQQTTVAQNHIHAGGMCGHGVQGRYATNNTPEGNPAATGKTRMRGRRNGRDEDTNKLFCLCPG